MARPSPRLPPVTRATLPVRSKRSPAGQPSGSTPIGHGGSWSTARSAARWARSSTTSPNASIFGLSASPLHHPGVAALEHDGQLEAGQDHVVVDLVDRPAALALVVVEQLGADGHAGVVDVAAGGAGPSSGSGQPLMTQPRSSSGSPTVAISQSTMAASRAGAPWRNMTLANW